MSNKQLPQISANELRKLIEKLGFEFIRQHGSHMFFRNKNGKTTTIPNHPGEKLDRGLLNKIIKQDLEMSRESFLKLLK